jgi:ADP-ribosyl-[dinitrogen reductase] hydrolase
MNYTFEQLKSAVFGLVVGDALGVPVEFEPRWKLRENPVENMRAFGTYKQPAGTWSDDSSLTLCLLDSLCEGYDLYDIAQKFSDWLFNNYWTPHGKVFDVGTSTYAAINRFEREGNPEISGNNDEQSNGNGSLMRILPLAFYIADLPIEQRFQKIKEVSSITHAHLRSVLGCFIYIEMILEVIQTNDKIQAYQNTQKNVLDFIAQNPELQSEATHYDNILKQNIADLEEQAIRGSGYVVHCLEASLWCFLKTENYEEAVLKAVNLGEDTDTTGAVTGGLAGLFYGFEQIPQAWYQEIVRRNDILNLIQRFQNKIKND